MKHYQIFGDSKKSLKNNALVSIESWEELRKNHPHFSVSHNREEWLEAVELKVTKDGQDNGLFLRADNIVDLLKKECIKSVFSVGVGGAGLEYQIKKKMPGITMVCSEYSQKNVDILKKVFIESSDIVTFDIVKGDWKQIKDFYLHDYTSTLLMYRLDAGFTNKEWREIFESIFSSGIDRIIYIPTTLLTVLSIFNRKKRELEWFIKKEQISFCGYLRTQKEFESFWSGLYEQEVMVFGGLKGFFLKRKEK